MSMEIILNAAELVRPRGVCGDATSTGRISRQAFVSVDALKLFHGEAPEISDFIEWRDLARRYLQTWAKNERKISQKFFWRFFDTIRRSDGDHEQIRNLLVHEFAHSYLNHNSKRNTEVALALRNIVDGQRKLSSLDLSRDLSSRAIRFILEAAIEDIDNFEDGDCFDDLVATLSNSLSSNCFDARALGRPTRTSLSYQSSCAIDAQLGSVFYHSYRKSAARIV